LESVTTMRGNDLIYEEDPFCTLGRAACALVRQKEITELLETGGTITTRHEYICYTYDDFNQLTGMTACAEVYGSTESHATLAGETFAYGTSGSARDTGLESSVTGRLRCCRTVGVRGNGSPGAARPVPPANQAIGVPCGVSGGCGRMGAD
jgi:hypothetical protein